MNADCLLIDSPLGGLRLVGMTDALLGIYFLDQHPQPERSEGPVASSLLLETSRQLEEYFSGRRTCFELPLAPRGTRFQRQVWQALVELEFGITCSYADLARRIDQPRAVRAVAAANAKNPLSIVIPCHRVIGASGQLTGYAGGLERKAWLIAHECRAQKRDGPRGRTRRVGALRRRERCELEV